MCRTSRGSMDTGNGSGEVGVSGTVYRSVMESRVWDHSYLVGGVCKVNLLAD